MHEMMVYFAGCDLSPKGHVRCGAYLREMQKAAALDLKNYGVPPEVLYERSLAFVLSKTSLVVDTPENVPHELKLCTYPRECRGATFLRDFVFTDYDGNTVARATTRWALIDLSRRTLCRPDVINVIPPQTGLWVGFETPRFDVKVPEDAAFLGKATVALSRTDANSHLNNAAYLDLCLDFAGDENFREMHIEYRREVTAGAGLSLYRAGLAEGGYMLYGVREEDAAVSFAAKFI